MMKEAHNYNSIIDIANQFDMKTISHQRKNCMISFFRDGIRWNVYYSTMTVGICYDGKQRFMKNVSRDILIELFANHEYEN